MTDGKRDESGAPNSGKRDKTMSIFGVLGIVFFVVCIAVSFVVPEIDCRPFDSQIWKACSLAKTEAPKSQDLGPVEQVRRQQDRCRMLKDFTSRYHLVGMTEKEVDELLGPDDGYFKTKYSQDKPGDWQRTYRLGAPTINPMDFDVKVLLLRIENGKVSRYSVAVYQD